VIGDNRAVTRIILLLLCAGVASAQVRPANPGFEQGELGGQPAGWFSPPLVVQAGFGVKLVDQGCRTDRCAMMTGVQSAPANVFGNIMQSLPAAGYALHRIRLRAAIRVEGQATRAQMWLRLDRADNSMAFLENMGSRPIVSSDWRTYDIETDVPDDIAHIVLGVMLFGPGAAWVDDVSLEITGDIRKDSVDPPRPLTLQGLSNLTAFTRLYGYVRFFHPSDQAARTDWETFAVQGIRAVEDAGTNAELIDRLRTIFAPVAPTVQVYRTGTPPLPAQAAAAPEIMRYHHNGVGLPSGVVNNNIYSSVRQRVSVSDGVVRKPFTAELVAGVTASVPLDLYVDAGGTLPHAPPVDPPVRYDRTPADRATRLAAVVIAWNVMQHFYPYFDVVKTDWTAELSMALTAAATDAGVDDFHKTLRRLVAALHDGHGNVASPGAQGSMVAPVTMDWVAGDFLVTRVPKGKSEGVAPGDRVLKIDGRPIAQAAAEVRSLISGATDQWVRYRSSGELSTCHAGPRTGRIALELEPYGAPGTSKTVELVCVPPRYKDMETYTEPRPEKITELEPGVLYVDLDRVSEEDWQAVVPRLAAAKGIIFDMRGYPGQPGIQALAHLTEVTIRCARWNVSSAALPDRLDSPYHESGWNVPPEKPYFNARRAFLTDGRAISYAETVMGIVENFKLGAIVGEATAGTNGNVNPFRLPGGYTVSWTGMKVLKHDGSQHHGIGIRPTVPVSRTRKGVAEGADEILVRAIQYVKSGE
jgi:C-terminal processing protease CtpA/Prc